VGLIGTLALTDRDLELLGFIAGYKCAPLDLLAARFFAYVLATGLETKNPERACEKRVLELARAGYVTTKIIKGRVPDKTTLAVTLTPAAAAVVDAPRPKSLPIRGRVHHMQTLRAVEDLRAELAKSGQRIGRVRLEFQQRSEVQRGRATRRGEEYECFADALVLVEETGPDGAVHTYELALEYVTSKYTDRDILDKAESFKRFDRTVFVSDTPRTAARVTRLTGEPCRCL